MPGSEFEPRGQRVEQGASEARKRPGGAFVARCACRGAVVPRASLVARSIKHHNEGCGAFSFTLPWAGEVAAPMALHGAKGVFSFAKENTPFISPRERLTLRDWHLKSCTRCAIGCGVHGFAMSLLRVVTGSNRAHSVARE